MLCYFVTNITIAQDLSFSCGTVDDSPDDGADQLVSTCSPTDSYSRNFNQRYLDKLIPSDASGNLILKTNIIIVQNEDGEGNFDYYGNATHRDFLDDVFNRVNERMIDLSPDCTPGGSPTGYSSLKIQFEPNFIVLEDNVYYNHRNDPEKTDFLQIRSHISML